MTYECFFPSPDLLEKCKGDLFEVKDGHSNTQASLLENLVYFVEVSVFILEKIHSCLEKLKPIPASLFFRRPFVSHCGCAITAEVSSDP